ncbi:tRNA-(ms[2]io[6]A)-hydroxylase [Thalassotalea sp. M1531]|uniref:tRNA-(Ms[2]io[6]A)-hydroxylase n=1 Tax=Thalassotalea algicola TaxID=2716224 RepID=A0A7Y0Q6D8_9GAMM|nr:tRNA isopentenyl-2-thiomethyl-A-37 hydroxylase MiaE [Thalassotalea algicola]NMP31263.1 tRNA-(ms[2]io[6]A)-hydroxylase [Thalassotalea algicola]
MSTEQLLAPIKSFLQCDTPQAWIDKAKQPEQLEILLIDHMICELKAAQTAMYLIRKYAVDKESGDALLAWLAPYEEFIYRKNGSLAELADKNKLSKNILPKAQSAYGQDLIDKMVLLIKEELHHFYQVLEIMDRRGIEYRSITPSRYAKGMIRNVTSYEPNTLVDKLIIGAYIEARSCERFAKLAPYLDQELHDFYLSLLRSEARHYQDYLALAEQVAGQSIDDRVTFFGKLEAELISSPDSDFKFHSGLPG